MQENTDSYLFTTPSSSLMSESLLFFDTFSHSSSEEEIFDLVQFPTPVIIDLIKIIPLGQPIEANIPGNVRLGATNPSNCEIKFFINDLSQQDADKMADLGKFQCSEKETDFNPPIQVQTDGLLLRGSYRTLTLAIFGQIAVYDSKIEDIQAVPSAASPPVQTPASPVASERDLPYVVSRRVDDVHEMVVRQQESSESVDHSTIRSPAELLKEDELLLDEEDAIVEYSSSKDDIRDTAANEDITMSEIGPSGNQDKNSIEREYSNSLDNESFSRHSSIKNDSMRSTRENIEAKNNSEIIGYNKSSNISTSEDHNHPDEDIDEWTFNPETYNPTSLIYFIDPSLTSHERATRGGNESNENNSKYSSSLEKDIKRVIEMFEFVDPNSDEWVTLIEEVANYISNLSLYEPLVCQEIIQFLVKQICHGLDLEMALKQKQTGFKVRHLKAGIRLANNLIQCGPIAVKAVLDASILHKLIDLYDKEQMSLPVRLMIFRCLNVACDFVDALNYIIYKKDRLVGKVYQLENHKCSTTQQQQQEHLEIKPSIADSEANVKMQSSGTSTSSSVADNPNPLVELTCYEALVMILISKPTTRALIAVGNLIKKIRLFKNLLDLSELSKKTNVEDVEGRDNEDTTSNNAMIFHLKPNDLETCCNLIQDIVNLTKDINTSIGQPIRYLPAESQFHVQHKPTDSHLSFYKWVKYFDTLLMINNLLSTSRAEIHDNASNIDLERSIRLRNLCLTLIQNIVDSPCGVNFLLSEDLSKTTGDILNALRTKDYTSKRPNHLRLPDEIDTCVNSSVHREESQLECRSCDMYLRLVYSFKIFSCLDSLFYFHNELLKKKPSRMVLIDEPERILHQIYILCNHAYGLESFVKHLSTIGNLDCLLRFFDVPESNKQLEFVRETAIDYTFELVGTFFRLNNQILPISDEYLETLIDLSKTKDKNLSVRMKSFLPWLTPFDPPGIVYLNYSDDHFKSLTRVIRKSITNHSISFANDLDYELPPKLITAVRMLRQLCIPPEVEAYIDSIFDPFSSQAQMDKLINESKPSGMFTEHHVMAETHVAPHRTNQSWNMSFNQTSRNPLSNPLCSLYDDQFNVEQLNQMSSLFKLFEPYDEDICGELKYHYAIMKLYEQEGLKRLLNTLRELIGNYPHPNFQSAALSGLRGRIVLSYIHSVILLLQSIVFHLMDARGSEFQDTSIIPVILEIYSLLCFVPNPSTSSSMPGVGPTTTGTPLVNQTDRLHEEDSEMENHQETRLSEVNRLLTIKLHNYQLAYKTKTIILAILMGYTQLCLSVSDNEEKVISKSMWTKMLKEVIEFTMSNPISFIHGLEVLTKIIPAPLPSSSMMDSIDQEQLFKNINHRKLWSAHLHPLHNQIEQMISALSITHRSNLRALLYYFCNQLCDLSSNAAYIVVKIITKTLVSCAARLSIESAASISTPPEPQIGCQSVNQQEQQQQQQQQQSNSSTSCTGGNSANQALINNQDDLRISLFKNSQLLSGSKEVAHVAKMILNLLSNVITNQAFETAFANHLQRLSKKDEKLLANLKDTLKYHEDYKPGDLVDESTGSASTTAAAQGCVNTVSSFIESIKIMAESGILGPTSKDSNLENLTPPDSLIKLNLSEFARKVCIDRFPIYANIKKTYRLKVLMDLKSREKSTGNVPPQNQISTNGAGIPSSTATSSSSRSFIDSYNNYPDNSSSMNSNAGHHKQPTLLGPPLTPGFVSSGSSSSAFRSRALGRSGGPMGGSHRPDFRSRPQNTSRPPSIHVDDFNDLYGGSSAPSSAGDRRSRLPYNDYANAHQHPQVSRGGDHHHQQHYFSPPPPGGPYAVGSNSSRGQSSSSSSAGYSSSKAKYMKMK